MANKEVRFKITATDSATPAIDKLRKSLGTVSAASNDIGASFRGLGTAIVGALSIGSIATFAANTVRGLEALKDLSIATGASVENISALEDVAARTGIGFDTVSTALAKFNKLLIDAKPGSQAALGLEQIGLSVKELRALDPAEAFRLYSVALGKFADDGDKARLVQDQLGKSFREVAPLIEELARVGKLNATVTTEQANQAKELADNLGKIQKSGTDAARALAGPMVSALTDVTAAMAEAAKESGVWASLWVGLGGLLAKSTVGQFFDLEGSDKFRKEIEARRVEIKRLGEAIDANERLAGEGDKRAAGRLLEIRKRLEELLSIQARANEQLKASVAGGGRGLVNPETVKPEIGTPPDAGKIASAAKQYAELIARIQGAVSASNEEADAQAKLTDSQRLGLEIVKQLSSSENALSNDAKRRVADILQGAILNIRANELRAQNSAALMRAFEAEAHASDAAVSAIQDTITSRTEENRQLSESVTLYGASADAIERHRIQLLENTLAVEDAAVAVERAHSGSTLEVMAMQASADALRKQIDLRKGLADANRQLGTDATKGAQNAIDDFLDSVRRAGDATYQAVSHTIMGLEDAVSVVGGRMKFNFSSVIDQILTDFLRLRVIKPLLANIFGGSVGDSGLTFASMFGQFFGGARASGGPVATGRAYLVGEHGPELMIPRAAGQVVPITEKSGGSWGGITINPVYNIGSNVSRAEIVQAIALGNARLKADLARQSRHGSGAYA